MIEDICPPPWRTKDRRRSISQPSSTPFAAQRRIFFFAGARTSAVHFWTGRQGAGWIPMPHRGTVPIHRAAGQCARREWLSTPVSFRPFAKNRSRFQGSIVGLSSGWWHDNDFSLARTLELQIRNHHAESKRLIVREPMVTIEDQRRRRIQIGRRYLHAATLGPL